MKQANLWWAMKDLNPRPSRCKRLTNQHVVDLYASSLPKTDGFSSILRKMTQIQLRKLRQWLEVAISIIIIAMVIASTYTLVTCFYDPAGCNNHLPRDL